MNGKHLTDLERLRLLELQLELECVRVASGDTLVPFPCSNPDPPPRLLITTIGNDDAMYFLTDLPRDVRYKLARLPPHQCANDEEAVRAILALDRPCDEVWRNRAYIFTENMESSTHRDVTRLSETNDIGSPIFGVIVNGNVVSSCSSIRENGKSGEAWVQTAPEYRGRGYAAQVTAAWGNDLYEQGKVAFYSHLIENTASQAVARKLELTPFMSAVGYG